MKKLLSFVLLFFLSFSILYAQPLDEKEVLRNLLTEFLEGASQNDAEIHDRFWAEELIYTSSNGERVTKADIMSGLGADEESVTPDYHAEQTQIRIYGDMAVVAFKLVAVSKMQGTNDRMEFYNTGTFQKRDGLWKAIAWQATRIPEE